MSDPFVGISSEPVDLKTLSKLIDKHMVSDGWFFLRWPHDVQLLRMSERFETTLDCWEGQAFNQNKELRWKKRGEAYEVLLLSCDGRDETLCALKQTLEKEIKWKTKDLEAKSYPGTETRLPKKVTVPKELNLGQRYFIDCKTECIQFVALRAK